MSDRVIKGGDVFRPIWSSQARERGLRLPVSVVRVGDERTESQLLPWEVRERVPTLVYSWPLKSTQMGV